jgi:hypothetical protein
MVADLFSLCNSVSRSAALPIEALVLFSWKRYECDYDEEITTNERLMKRLERARNISIDQQYKNDKRVSLTASTRIARRA